MLKTENQALRSGRNNVSFHRGVSFQRNVSFHRNVPVILKQVLCAFTIFIILFAANAANATAQAKDLVSAERYIRHLAPKAIKIARRKLSKSQRTSQYHRLVRTYAAIPAIALFSLGRYRKKLPARHKAEYYRLVGRFMAQFFTRYTAQFNGKRIEITKSKKRGPRDFILDAAIHYNGHSSPMQWRLIKRGRGYKVFDVKLLGVWLTLQMRSQFVSLLRSNKGNFNVLLAKLRKMN